MGTTWRCVFGRKKPDETATFKLCIEAPLIRLVKAAVCYWRHNGVSSTKCGYGVSIMHSTAELFKTKLLITKIVNSHLKFRLSSFVSLKKENNFLPDLLRRKEEKPGRLVHLPGFGQRRSSGVCADGRL